MDNNRNVITKKVDLDSIMIDMVRLYEYIHIVSQPVLVAKRVLKIFRKTQEKGGCEDGDLLKIMEFLSCDIRRCEAYIEKEFERMGKRLQDVVEATSNGGCYEYQFETLTKMLQQDVPRTTKSLMESFKISKHDYNSSAYYYCLEWLRKQKDDEESFSNVDMMKLELEVIMMEMVKVCEKTFCNVTTDMDSLLDAGGYEDVMKMTEENASSNPGRFSMVSGFKKLSKRLQEAAVAFNGGYEIQLERFMKMQHSETTITTTRRSL